jgi:DNA-binding response OmpR family regulator
VELTRRFVEPHAVVILNASPDQSLLNTRAEVLHEAGYYTSSANTSDEAIALATQLNFPVVIICHGFKDEERQLLSERIREILPSTKIIFLQNGDFDAQHLISTVRRALPEVSNSSQRTT